MKETLESSGVGVASGQFSPSLCQVWHVERHPLFLLDTTMERNFPWSYHWIYSRGDDFNMPFAVSNFSVKSILPLNTGPEQRHYFSKIGENKSHCLITNELRKKDSD